MRIVQGSTYLYSSSEDHAWLDQNNGLIVRAEKAIDCPGCWEVSCLVSGRSFVVFDDELHGVTCNGTERIKARDLVTPRVPMRRLFVGHIYKVQAVGDDGGLDLYINNHIVGPYRAECFKKVERK